MMTIQTLAQTSTDEILDVFNLSFSDYLVPFHLTKDQLEAKIKAENIQLELSVGAFENNKLIGFILHGFDILDNQRIIYNAGTGVIPSRRGQGITLQLYKFILPVLQARNIDHVVLEVITKNKPAIKTYERIGFLVNRKLDCYKGSIINEHNPGNYILKKLESYNWQKLQSFWDIKPSWQNSITAIEKVKELNVPIGVYDDELLVGYIIYNPTTKRVQQFAIDKNYRNKGLAKKLFHHIAGNYNNELSIINVDNGSKDTTYFLNKIGLKNYVSQYEMLLKLK